MIKPPKKKYLTCASDFILLLKAEKRDQLYVLSIHFWLSSLLKLAMLSDKHPILMSWSETLIRFLEINVSHWTQSSQLTVSLLSKPTLNPKHQTAAAAGGPFYLCHEAETFWGPEANHAPILQIWHHPLQ